MVSSLDGFIAKRDGSVSWMQSGDNYKNGIVLSDEDIDSFLRGIDCYVMGSNTYEHALELGWPYGDVPVVVLTKRQLKRERETVSFVSGDLKTLLQNALRSKYKNIWMVGGSELTQDFIRLRLADEIVISIVPVILGDGKRFFDDVGIEQKLHLKDVKAYKDGMVELTYQFI